jgi:hypothetical protein
MTQKQGGFGQQGVFGCKPQIDTLVLGWDLNALKRLYYFFPSERREGSCFVVVVNWLMTQKQWSSITKLQEIVIISVI